MVASVVMSFSRMVVCLENKAGSLSKEWYLMHSVKCISVLITLGPFNSIGAEKDEKLERTMSA